MKPMHESSVGDLASLQMENELLVHEVRFVRAKIKAQERAHAGRLASLTESQQKVRETQGKLKEARQRARDLVEERDGARAKLKETRDRLRKTRAQAERGRQAHADVTWLVTRLDGSILGVALRRTSGFAALRTRYIGNRSRRPDSAA